MQSLLGQFYNKIKGSQEDIASEGLAYILQKSIDSRNVINQIIRINTNLEFSDLSYQTQNVGKNNERPDISGIDKTGKEVLLIEAKFWASLTKNQPNGYLERLADNTILVFLVPTLRLKTVYNEVRSRITAKYKDFDTISDNHIRIKSTNQHVLIKSWDEILNSIKSKLEQLQDQILLSDVNQIIGLCETIDNNAFQPIRDIDLSPKIPKNINSYYGIIDKVVGELLNRNKKYSVKGLVKTPQRFGYHRYFSTAEFGLNFALKFDLWEHFADTPFWLSIKEKKDNEWEFSETFKKKIELLSVKLDFIIVPYSNNKGCFISLKPELYETEDVVIKKLADRIETIIKEMN